MMLHMYVCTYDFILLYISSVYLVPLIWSQFFLEVRMYVLMEECCFIGDFAVSTRM